MESIKDIFKIGYGPSSSHTMGPQRAAVMFQKKTPDAAKYKVILYGSLAATGRGHLTDKVLIKTLHPKELEIEWHPEVFLDYHPNALEFVALDADGNAMQKWLVYSVGGGDIEDLEDKEIRQNVYPMENMKDILNWSKKYGKTLWEYVQENENPDIWDYLGDVWKTMKKSVERGLEAEGAMPGGLNLPRKAASYYVKAKSFNSSLKRRSLAFSYALAVSEENACGGKIVTAPTCGSSGILPATLYLLNVDFEFSTQRILRALATAGLVGNIAKTNASISGAQVGCQGEVGVACAMAAAAGAQVFGGTPSQIEYAAEMGLEHHLGLTCDPIGGLVQVPCIERNAFGVARALDSCTYAILSDGRHIVSFDKIVQTMKQTGHDIPSIYKETSEGGLAHYMPLETM